MRRRRDRDFGQRPGPLRIRPVDNTTSITGSVAIVPWNQITATGLLLADRRH